MKFLSVFSVLLFAAVNSAYALPTTSKHFDQDAVMAESLMTADYNFDGTVKISGCSGALVRFERSKDSDKGMMLSNGHCHSSGPFGGMIPANKFLYQQAHSVGVQFLNPDGSFKTGGVKTTKVLYATMTGTDVSLYELDKSYAQIKKEFNVNALTIDSKRPTAGQEIDIVSGYWQKGYSCSIDTFVYQVKEDAYTWNDSMRYSKGGCQTIHGTSGAPIVSRNTGLIVGINNTGNDEGKKCTMNNPCEVSTTGQVYVEKGRSYGQQTYIFYTCLNTANQIDLNQAGCKLFH